MSRMPTWKDVPRTPAGLFASRQACIPQATCSRPPAAVEVVKTVTITTARQTASEVAKGAVRSTAPVAAAFVIAEATYAIVQCSRGKISKREAIGRSVSSAAGGASGVGGAALGAVIGTVIFPAVGTAAGAFIGSVICGIAGRWGADKALSQSRFAPKAI